MGAEEIAFLGRLVRTPQGDEVHLSDGQTIKLAHQLPYPDGQELTVGILTRARYQSQKQELAKQLLQEILHG